MTTSAAAAQGWISVQERLPPARPDSRWGYSEIVEILYDGHACETMYYHTGGGWLLMQVQEKVTHWRPVLFRAE